ncbi:hypothetical protein RHSIM_Rhsim02G0239900 [Rhododendron simsii]|uniref:Glycosyltransferase n=1 Tax=Rhododendron simsii TaxID=118357 RepID=A0A834LX36_RHOSS|nr:hypothetical protein RHSIM_Rhsim02G0239900 [Rhododendron simsii]
MEATQGSSRTTAPPLHVAIVPTPGMGHLIPLTEFATRLALRHNFSLTFIVPTDAVLPMTQQKSLLKSLPSSVTTVFLPPADFSSLPAGVRLETRISLSVTRSLPALRDSFRKLSESTRVSALVVDLFGTDAFDVGTEFGAAPYVFFPTTAMALSSLFYIQDFDRNSDSQLRDLSEPVKLPGCVPVRWEDFPDPVQDRKDEAYRWTLHHVKRYSLARGILVNSFLDLEPGAFKGLKEDWPGKPPVYPVGPLTRTSSGDVSDESDQCLKWLDEQSRGSVLFVSFGSGGTLSHEQLIELALGLELSGVRFLWVVKSPNEDASNAAYFTVHSMKDPFDFLPKGFMDRTKGLGLIVPSWAPQVRVLAHESTGGFLTHCGWNSVLESIVHGVPLIAWPLYAEQKMNAVLLTEDLKVAFRVAPNENGLVGREAIAKHAKDLIEGDEGKLLRNRMRDLNDAAAEVLSQDGSSTMSLSMVAHIWREGSPEKH